MKREVLSVLAGCLVGVLIDLMLGQSNLDVVAQPARAVNLGNEVESYNMAWPRPQSLAQADEVVERSRRSEMRGSAPRFEYAPRDPGEWQGMLVNITLQASCDVSSRCGLAMACRSGRCGPCGTDHECASGEACVLQHCLKAENVGCRSRSDCYDGALCLLNGYSPDARGNARTKSFCLRSGDEIPRDVHDFRDTEIGEEPDPRPNSASLDTDPSSPEALMKHLEAAAPGGR